MEVEQKHTAPVRSHVKRVDFVHRCSIVSLLDRRFIGTPKNKTDAKPFAAANGSPIHNLGNFTIDFETVEGHKRSVLFNNANVAFPSFEKSYAILLFMLFLILN